jgi:RNase P protein component
MSYVSSVRGGEPVTQIHQVAFAISRKFGNAVERNRARRRLRASFAGLISARSDNPPPFGLYLLLPSRSVLTMPHRDLVRLLQECFDQLETADLMQQVT